MAEGLKWAVELAQRVRFSRDRSKARGEIQTHPGAAHFRYSMATNGLRISHAVTPKLAKSLDQVLGRLGVPGDAIEAYVYDSHELNAMCCMVNVRAAVLSFSSRLVNLLSSEELEFVAGHEIGHFLLGHEARATNAGSLEEFRQSPAQEISADRIGMLAGTSVEAGVRALMKTACGLGDDQLRFDIGAYLSQIRNLEAPDLRGTQMPTHPSMAVRCRALLWFSLHASNFRPGEVPRDANALSKVDGYIARDLETFCEQPIQQELQSTRDDYLLWYSAHKAMEDGRLEKYEQAALRALLSEIDRRAEHGEDYTYQKLMGIIPGMSVAEVLSFVTDRLDESRKILIEKLGDGYADVLRTLEGRVDTVFADCRRQFKG